MTFCAKKPPRLVTKAFIGRENASARPLRKREDIAKIKGCSANKPIEPLQIRT